jgi:Fe2+ transport system protein FeoA
MISMIPLRALRIGQVAEVHELVGPSDAVRRLEEVGLRRGARLELVRGGATCIVRVDGATFCFREEKSVRVLVSPRMTA